ncbi:unnamed protein product [Rotaria sordida]|uniref:Uncharacterized protein n=1 Tax=Rotaria sordida TaxID=392033 RepID=A0A819MWI8_9BILA|nr:unnamed protein product [Rotaria sordida]CAF3988225.1 unnamed protein product [Rotaria sordida]
METLCFHPNSNYIATSSLDRILKIWNLLECKEGQQMIPIRQMSGHKLNIYILKFSKDAKYEFVTYRTKRTSTTLLHFTRRNLLLGFGVFISPNESTTKTKT